MRRLIPLLAVPFLLTGMAPAPISLRAFWDPAAPQHSMQAAVDAAIVQGVPLVAEEGTYNLGDFTPAVNAIKVRGNLTLVGNGRRLTSFTWGPDYPQSHGFVVNQRIAFLQIPHDGSGSGSGSIRASGFSVYPPRQDLTTPNSRLPVMSVFDGENGSFANNTHREIIVEDVDAPDGNRGGTFVVMNPPSPRSSGGTARLEIRRCQINTTRSGIECFANPGCTTALLVWDTSITCTASASAAGNAVYAPPDVGQDGLNVTISNPNRAGWKCATDSAVTPNPVPITLTNIRVLAAQTAFAVGRDTPVIITNPLVTSACDVGFQLYNSASIHGGYCGARTAFAHTGDANPDRSRGYLAVTGMAFGGCWSVYSNQWVGYTATFDNCNIRGDGGAGVLFSDNAGDTAIRGCTFRMTQAKMIASLGMDGNGLGASWEFRGNRVYGGQFSNGLFGLIRPPKRAVLVDNVFSPDAPTAAFYADPGGFSKQLTGYGNVFGTTGIIGPAWNSPYGPMLIQRLSASPTGQAESGDVQ